MESFKPLIAKVAAGSQLSRADAADAFDAILSGEVTPSQLGGFLMALRVRGETVEEITGEKNVLFGHGHLQAKNWSLSPASLRRVRAGPVCKRRC